MTTTNGTRAPLPDEQGELFTPYPRIVLRTTVQVEGYTFDVTFNDTSLSAAVEVLKKRDCQPAAGLVSAPPTAPASQAKPTRKTVDPFYDGSGDACCPVHHKALQEGKFGLFCSAKAKGDEVADGRGYCGLKFR